MKAELCQYSVLNYFVEATGDKTSNEISKLQADAKGLFSLRFPKSQPDFSKEVTFKVTLFCFTRTKSVIHVYYAYYN